MTILDLINQMHKIMEEQGFQKAGIFAHRQTEPQRTTLLKQLLLDAQMDYTVFEMNWVKGILEGRIK